MPGPQRARHSAARPPSISSVAAFAAAPAHVVRRPGRVACALFAVLVLLTLSALEIGGKKALSEPHSPSQDELAQLGAAASVTASRQAAPQLTPVARVGAAKQPAVEADRDEVVDDRPAGREAVEEVLLDEDEQLPVCDKSVVFRFAGASFFAPSLLLEAPADSDVVRSQACTASAPRSPSSCASPPSRATSATPSSSTPLRGTTARGTTTSSRSTRPSLPSPPRPTTPHPRPPVAFRRATPSATSSLSRATSTRPPPGATRSTRRSSLGGPTATTSCGRRATWTASTRRSCACSPTPTSSRRSTARTSSSSRGARPSRRSSRRGGRFPPSTSGPFSG